MDDPQAASDFVRQTLAARVAGASLDALAAPSAQLPPESGYGAGEMPEGRSLS